MTDQDAENREKETLAANDENEVTLNVGYIRRSCALITEALHKGCDVIQMPNGDIIITELRELTYQYSWDNKRGKMVRVKSGSRVRRSRLDSPDLEISNEPSTFDKTLEESNT